MGEHAEYGEATAGDRLHDGDRRLRERGEHERGAAHVHEESADPEPVQRVRPNHLELEGEGREDVGALLLEDLADVVAGGAGQRERHRLPHLASATAVPIRSDAALGEPSGVGFGGVSPSLLF